MISIRRFLNIYWIFALIFETAFPKCEEGSVLSKLKLRQKRSNVDLGRKCQSLEIKCGKGFVPVEIDAEKCIWSRECSKSSTWKRAKNKYSQDKHPSVYVADVKETPRGHRWKCCMTNDFKFMKCETKSVGKSLNQGFISIRKSFSEKALGFVKAEVCKARPRQKDYCKKRDEEKKDRKKPDNEDNGDPKDGEPKNADNSNSDTNGKNDGTDTRGVDNNGNNNGNSDGSNNGNSNSNNGNSDGNSNSVNDGNSNSGNQGNSNSGNQGNSNSGNNNVGNSNADSGSSNSNSNSLNGNNGNSGSNANSGSNSNAGSPNDANLGLLGLLCLLGCEGQGIGVVPAMAVAQSPATTAATTAAPTMSTTTDSTTSTTSDTTTTSTTTTATTTTTTTATTTTSTTSTSTTSTSATTTTSTTSATTTTTTSATTTTTTSATTTSSTTTSATTTTTTSPVTCDPTGGNIPAVDAHAASGVSSTAPYPEGTALNLVCGGHATASSGATTINCQSDGTWDGSLGLCGEDCVAAEAGNFQTLHTSTGAGVISSAAAADGQTATFTCVVAGDTSPYFYFETDGGASTYIGQARKIGPSTKTTPMKCVGGEWHWGGNTLAGPFGKITHIDCYT